MKRVLLMTVCLLAIGGIAHASALTGYACNGWGLTWLTGPSICGSAPSPPAPGFLLVDTGVVLLVDVGNKFLVQ